MNKLKINTTSLEIEGLMDHIEEEYDGNILYLISNLDHAIYLFHFLCQDTVSSQDIRRTSLALKHLRECFMKSHLKSVGLPYHSIV